jgi:phosphopantetheinyl transferase
VGSPRSPDGRKNLILGAPYPLDAAFHAACAWGQYAAHIVAFPVAIDHRKIVRPTRLDESYIARVLPRDVTGETLVYDIFIFDRRGNLCEVSTGVHMRDISGGRTHPPDWIRKQNRENRLVTLEGSGQSIVVIDRRCMAPFADAALSALELQRYAPMAPGRRNSFLAARLALKRLSRNLSGQAQSLAPEQIDTVRADSPKPVCPAADRSKPLHCSVSHDNRFAVAVAADTPVGIDVEPITAKAFKNRRLFTDEAEFVLMRSFPEGAVAAALRVWSAKEAAAKALDMPLAHAWERVRLTALGLTESRLQVEGVGTRGVLHDTVDGHLFTLFTL